MYVNGFCGYEINEWDYKRDDVMFITTQDPLIGC